MRSGKADDCTEYADLRMLDYRGRTLLRKVNKAIGKLSKTSR